MPNPKLVRPTLAKTRESVFNILKMMIDFENALFLDCFAGSGIMSAQAYSFGFEKVFCIEKNPQVAKIIKQNLDNLDVKYTLKIANTLNILDRIKASFDVIYVDPPYNLDVYERVLKAIKQSNLLKLNGVLVCECKKVRDINDANFRILDEKIYNDTKLVFLSNK